MTKLATAIRGGEPPDVVDMDDINSSLFIFRDVFADLTSVVEALPYYDKLSTGHMGLLKHDGKIFGVPYLADNSMLFYNSELLQKADVDPASLSTGFDGLLAAAKSVQKLGGDIHALEHVGRRGGHPRVHRAAEHLGDRAPTCRIGTLGKQHGHIVGNDALERTLAFYRQLWVDKLVSSQRLLRRRARRGEPTSGRAPSGMIPISWGSVYTAPTRPC